MGFHTFTAGEVLTAANVNTYLMNQAVVVCTSGTRPASPVAGMVIYETDTLLYQSYTGAAWVAIASNAAAASILAWLPYAATFTNFTQGNAAVISRYQQIGKRVTFAVTVAPGSTSSYGGIASVSLPAQAAAGYEQQVLTKYWNGTNTDVGLGQITASGTTVTLLTHLTTGSSALGNYQGTSLGVVVNSAVTGNFAVYGTYEAL